MALRIDREVGRKLAVVLNDSRMGEWISAELARLVKELGNGPAIQ